MRLFIYVVLAFTLLTASAQQLPLETYTPANGLVDARVIKMFQDSKGRIYFLTREGFSIFDGQRFSNFGDRGNNRTEIINGVTEYKDGTVRLYSFDGNIYEVSGNKVTIDSSQHKLLTEANITIDISPEEKIIVTNYLLLREKNKKIEQIKIPFAYNKTPRIDNIFWVNPYLVFFCNTPGNGSALYLYNYRSQLLVDSLTLEDANISAVDKKGNIYFLTKKWMQLDQESLSKGKLKQAPADFANQLPASFSNAILSFDNNNDLWFSSNELGYCKLNRQDKTTEYFTVAAGVLSGAGFVFQDAEKNYWFTSLTNGVQKMQQSPLTKINSFKNIATGYFNSINADEKGNVFIASSTGFFLNDDKIPGGNGASAYKSFYYQGQYWQFTNYKTLKSSKGVQFKLADYVKDYTQYDLSPFFTSIDKEVRLIISGNVLFIIDKDLRLVTYRLPYFCDNVVVDDNNNYWCFSRSNTIIKLEWKDGELHEVYKRFIAGLNPRFSVLWNSNTILTGTRFEGIKIFRWQKNELICTGTISKKNGLSNNFIYSLLKKNEQQLLVGTGTGLDLLTITGKDTIAENLSLRNNIFPPFINLINTKDSSTICLTGSGNLYHLQKETKFSSGYIPTAFFRSIVANGQQINIDENAFSYNKNNFLFSISAPSFLDNKNMKFHFVLTGDGTAWEQHTNNADYTINNLQPGSYTLTTTIQYPGRFYPDKQLFYSFTIKNPFWKQWWFILLWIITAIAVIYLLLNNYYKKQLAKKLVGVEKQQAVERERSRIAADMHDDLGSGLTKITYLSQMAINKEDSKADLLAIKKTSTELVENMSEIIWAMKEENNSLEDLLYYIKVYAVEYCAANHLNCIIQFPEKLPAGNITGQNRRNIYLAAKETLHNVVKHAHAEIVTITVSFDKGWVLSIKDDGGGIAINAIRPDQLFGGNGLKNIKNRIKAVNGRVEIINNQGTEVQFHIPF
ncbi:MAG: ATP-binding protein [Ferruginibacter sp.]